VNLANTSGWDADKVKAVAQEANNKLTKLGYEVQNCLVDLGETAESVVLGRLSRDNCVMIGAALGYYHRILFCLRK